MGNGVWQKVMQVKIIENLFLIVINDDNFDNGVNAYYLNVFLLILCYEIL